MFKARTALLFATIAIVTWGALAFGAVYPWAYVPLAAVSAIIGGIGLHRYRARPPDSRALGFALVAVAMAIALQIVPLPKTVSEHVSPNRASFLRAFDLSFGVISAGNGPQNLQGDSGRSVGQALSIAPRKTALGLCLFIAFALLLLGSARVVSVCGADTIVRPVIALGIMLALFGIVQAAVWAPDPPEVIYGFWHPQFRARPFGPFINPNHFAGWMLMVIPLALAGFYDALLRVLASSRWTAGYWRDLFGSSDAGRVLAFGIGAGVMGLSLLMTRSRSGLGAFIASSALAAWAVGRRQSTVRARSLVAVSCLLLLVVTFAWAGAETVTGKFIEASQSSQGISSIGGRIDIWRDTAGIIRRFPLVGTGFDTYGLAMMVYQTRNLAVNFREAHNDYLQLVAEGGLLVCVPIAIAVGIFVRDVRRRFREAPHEGTTYWLRIGAVIGMIAVAIQSLVEFSLQMPGSAAMFVLLGSIALNRSPRLNLSSE